MGERPDFPKIEEGVLAFWKEHNIFKKTLEKPAPQGDFIFFEGPPTANGQPGIHHVEARAYKDAIPRYKTMRGFRVERKAGWDTHGLPVELEVEKRLGVSGKHQIEAIKATPRESIAHFNQLCKKSVWTYLEDWKALTERIGFWLDLEHPYVTYHNEYIESLWWIVKQIHDRGLLYKDYKVVPYCARCGTPLSSHELALGYDEAEDPSIYVKFRVRGQERTYFLVWTTTPWTLPGNVALAVRDVLSYVKVARQRHPEQGEGSLRVYDPVGSGTLASASLPTSPPEADLRQRRMRLRSTPVADVGDSSSPEATQDDIEYLILAKERLSVLDGDYEVVEEYSGKSLEGWEYEPLYQFVDYGPPPPSPPPLEGEKKPALSAVEGRGWTKPFTVALADFVSTEEGTGIVHTAVMYGAEDFELGQKIGLPKAHLVDLRGQFIPEVKPWAGIFVKDADPKIVEDLRSRGLLYRQETIRHTYPFCWRCKTPLLYYAKESWYVRMSALRNELIRANDAINWVPSYIKDGRFGEWLREVKDWAFSRERYWGTPLPVWICDGCGAQKVVGGFADFPESPLGNSYWLLRHSEATHNTRGIVSGDPNAPYELTEAGKKQAQEVIEELKKTGLDLIFASPYRRTRETAEMIGKAFGVPVTSVDDLGDIKFGDYEGKSIEEWRGRYPRRARFAEAPAGGETYAEVLRRTVRSIREIDQQHQGKRILIVSHGDPLFLLDCAVRGLSEDGMVRSKEAYRFKTGELRKLVMRTLPFRDDGFVDPHRPFVDEVTFGCEKCSGIMRRTPEVIDVWFDSGSMPFAQWHYPFEAQQKIDRGEAFPADYISEAIDQTRGWFYTLLAVSVLLGRGAPYKNVICLGHVLDKEGKKMSKSLGNVVDPWEMVKKYGADAVRWYMYTVNQPGDAKLFHESDLDGIVKRTFMLLWNVLAFWKLYAPPLPNPPPRGGRDGVGVAPLTVRHVMDQWVLARLNALVKTTTERIDAYDLTTATRAVAEFIVDLSTWYVRRSRDRFRRGNAEAIVTLGHVLVTLAKLMAPFAPFLAESLYQAVGRTIPTLSPSKGGGEKEGVDSVHLASWPEAGDIDAELINEMEIVRRAVPLGHAIRDEQKIRVRQPLLDVELESPNLKLRSELLEILAEELNVKQAHVVRHLEEREGYAQKSEGGLAVALNLELTPELRREGWQREIIRHVNDLRKEAKLTIGDGVNIFYETSDAELAAVFIEGAEAIKRGGLAVAVRGARGGSGKELIIDGRHVWIGIEKVG